MSLFMHGKFGDARENIVVVAPFAYHENCGNGGGVICFRFLAGLAVKHSLTLVAFRSGPENDEVAGMALRAIGVELVLVDRPQLGRVRWNWFRLLQPLLNLPPEARELASLEMCNILRDQVKTSAAKVVIYQFAHMAQYAGMLDVRDVVEVIDVQDVFFVSKLRAFRSRRNGFRKLEGFLSWLAWARYEMRYYAKADLAMTLTEQDKTAIKIMLPDKPVFVNEPAVAKSKRKHLANQVDPVIGFAGNFSHPPNREALAWLSAELVEKILVVCPGAQIVVAGKGLSSAEVAALNPKLRYVGFVEDYAAFLDMCSIFVAPLRSGGGIKIKVLEALSAGCPVVTTSIGAEGFELGPAHGLYVGDDADGLVHHCSTVMSSINSALDSAERGSDVLAQKYGVDSRVSALIEQIGLLSSSKNATAL